MRGREPELGVTLSPWASGEARLGVTLSPCAAGEAQPLPTRRLPHTPWEAAGESPRAQGALSPVWEVEMALQAASYSLAQPQRTHGGQNQQIKTSACLSLPFR